MSKPSHVFRRLFHLSIIIYLIYYLVPEDFPFEFFGRKRLALLILFGILVFEAIRIKKRWVFFGIRKYEASQIAAFAWGAIAIVLALVFFPPHFAAPCIAGLATGDPLIGELKKARVGYIKKGTWKWYFIYPFAPAGIYACVVVLFGMPLNFVPLATLLAISAESVKIKYVDDNFTMIMVPLVVCTLLEFILKTWG